MIIVSGATGNVGSAVVDELLTLNKKFLAIAHSEKSQATLQKKGVEAVVADILDTNKLAEIFKRGTSAFLLNPPGDISKDAVKLEKETVRSMLQAVKTADLKNVVAQSTQGSQPGDSIGDFGVLYDLEEGLKEIGVPTAITRAAYYMSNWDIQLEGAKKGKIQSFYPADFKLPMICPKDLGKFNAQCLVSPPTEKFKITNVSGPKDYSANDVAAAFSKVLGQKVEVEVIPKEKWVEAYKTIGFSEVSAHSYAKMTEITLEHKYELPGSSVRGSTTIENHISMLAK